MVRTTLLSVFFATAIAQQADAQNDMRYFVGIWDLKAWPGVDTRGTPNIIATWTVEIEDSAQALTGHVVTKGSVFTNEIITFNPFDKSYTRTITTADGSSYTFSTMGWAGDYLVWKGTQRSPRGEVDLKEEIARTGPDAFRAVFYQRSGEAWLLQQTELLQRVKQQ